eukprot:CAMPEP_0194394034 /NCGR_PEP_ID=MMETSP0174-20130528/123631_1 /TAXON_ID=216777 /ORGANISM="Proboscia alata, Strain PI-D3" /LENGTH=852 /DNA_ID=CAMNT_0039189789 /DNA_START=100 /DNA_END=2654 /DNA_ORIENTATION=+
MQNLSTEINDSGNEKEVLALVQTPIPAIDPMDTPSKTASASNYLTARQELETETKRGCNEKEIMLLDQSPIPAIDPMNTASRPPIAKQGTKSGENSSPLHNTPHTPNNEAIEDSNARPGAYHIPGIGADRQEDTNPMDMSFTATPAATPIANLVSSQRSMIHQFVVALPLRQTLVNFKDKRVQLLFFLIAVVIISLSLVLVLVLDNESPSRNNDGIRTQPFPSNQPNDRTTPNPSANNIHNRSAYPTCNPSAFPTYLPSAYPTYQPSGIPSKVMIRSFSTAIAVVIISLSLVVVLLLNNGASNESFSKPPTSDMQNNQTTIAASDIPTAQLTYFPSANPSDVPSEHTIYLPSLIPSVHKRIPSKVKTLSFFTAMEIFVEISGEESLKNESSPQYLAMDWIVNHDEANMTLKAPTYLPSGHPTYLPSAYPTYLPSGIPSKVMILSFSTAMEIFVPISGEESLKNETSPQYLAMDWIVNHDGANMALKEEDKIIQRYALAVFYFSTQGKNWNHQYNFLSDKDVCAWNGYKNSTRDNLDQFSGVQRCDEAGNVQNIELVSENLTGTIPSELGMLTNLVDLKFNFNNLFGTVPIELSYISSLAEVDLVRNDLTGGMEAFCSNDIEYGWLAADCLGGDNAKMQCSCCDLCMPWLNYLPSAYPTYLPSGIPSKVMILSFSTAMEIFVPISGEESLKNETSPQYLAMDWIVNHDEANMALKDEDKIVQRYILAVLYYSTQGKNWNNQCNFLSEKDVCDWNEFTNSAIDDSIQFSGITRCDEAKNVENINLVNENLTGTIPSELGMLTKLTDLRLHSNNLFGTVPVILSNISSLGKVELMRNDLTGDMEAFCTNGIEYIW